jgi:hypothetical protein
MNDAWLWGMTMGITVLWDDEQRTVVRYVFQSEWTWDDFYVARNLVNGMVEGEAHPVAMLFDVPEDVVIPPNFVSKFATMFRTRPDNIYALVVVGGNDYVRALVGVLASVTDKTGNLLRAFYTEAQAHTWLKQRLYEQRRRVPA